MIPRETAALLSYCAGVDGWLKSASADEAAVMVAGWTDLLADVPAEFAMKVARTHYRTADARTLQPGDVSGAWRAERRLSDRNHDQAAERALSAAAAVDVMLTSGGSAAEYLRSMVDAVFRGHEPDTIQRPAGVRVLTREADERDRRCVYHKLCACSHDRCRDGWQDDPAQIVNGAGRRYEAAQRCPHCRDALLMAEERGVAKAPGHAAGRRR